MRAHRSISVKSSLHYVIHPHRYLFNYYIPCLFEWNKFSLYHLTMFLSVSFSPVAFFHSLLRKDADACKKWKGAVYRDDPVTGKNWTNGLALITL